MRKKTSPKPLRARVVMSLSVFAALIVVITSMALYAHFERVSQNQIYAAERDSLIQASYSADVMVDYAKTIAMQIYYDKYISRLRLFGELDGTTLSNAMNALSNYKNLSSYLLSVYVFNARNNVFHTTVISAGGRIQPATSFFDTEVAEMASDFSKISTLVPFPRSIPLPADTDGTVRTVDGFTCVFYESRTSARPSSVVVVNMTETPIKKAISRLNTDTDRGTWIVDDLGRTVIGTFDIPMGRDLSGEDFVRKALSDEEDSGFFLTDIRGERHLVVHASYEALDWTYLRTIPYNRITEQIQGMKRNTLFLSGLILLLGLAASLVQSRTLYRPLEPMLEELERLRAVYRAADAGKRQTRLRGLLTGSLAAEAAVRDGYLPDMTTLHVLILVRIDRYRDFCSQNSEEDRAVWRFGILNVAAELLEGEGAALTIDMESDSLVLLLPIGDSSGGSAGERLSPTLRFLQEQVLAHLGISISLFGCGSGFGIGQVPRAYQRCVDLSGRRILLGHGCLVWEDDVGTHETSDTDEAGYTFPSAQDKRFFEAAAAGKVEEAVLLCSDILSGAAQSGPGFFQLALTHLAFSLGSVLDRIERYGGVSIPGSFDGFVSRLAELETHAEAVDSFRRMLQAVQESLALSRSDTHDRLTAEMASYLSLHLRDVNLSLQMLSERFGKSPAYLGALFARHMGKTVPEYLNEIRIREAERLLRETNASIGEIYSLCGYGNPQYFNKVFKKAHGVTPTAYRTAHLPRQAFR